MTSNEPFSGSADGNATDPAQLPSITPSGYDPNVPQRNSPYEWEGQPVADPYGGWPPPPPPARRRPAKTKRALVGVGSAALAAGLVFSGAAIGNGLGSSNGSSTAQAQGSTGTAGSGTGSSDTSGSGTGTTPSGLVPGRIDANGADAAGGQTSASVATTAQQAGVVTVVSVLKYENAESAGTGMVLTANGEILTNNHVIEGATNIRVTVSTTGKSYRADVVGTDSSDDVAVIQLRNASGLTTAKIGSASVNVGDSVVGVGNANGTGTLRASSGDVTALNQSITASDESGADAERLTRLIETNAPIISGDSGGPLYDSSGEIVGIDTAAATTNGYQAATAYAIPIASAVTIADQIEAGNASATVRIGLPPFIGVAASPTSADGAAIASVVAGGPAERVGITAGSVITAVNGKTVHSDTSLQSRLSAHNPGDTVSISWTDASGTSHTARVTLAAGPAD